VSSCQHLPQAQEEELLMARRGLYANIHARRASGKKMRKKGAKGAPTDEAFRKAALTAKKPKKKKKKA